MFICIIVIITCIVTTDATGMQDCDEMTDKRGLGSTRRGRRRSGGGWWCTRERRGPRRRSSRRTWRRREGRRRGARSTLFSPLDPNQKLRVSQPSRAGNRKGTSSGRRGVCRRRKKGGTCRIPERWPTARIFPCSAGTPSPTPWLLPFRRLRTPLLLAAEKIEFPFCGLPICRPTVCLAFPFPGHVVFQGIFNLYQIIYIYSL
jgi:hypothetical protein